MLGVSVRLLVWFMKVSVPGDGRFSKMCRKCTKPQRSALGNDTPSSPRSVSFCFAVLRCAMLCGAILRHALFCYAMLCCALRRDAVRFSASFAQHRTLTSPVGRGGPRRWRRSRRLRRRRRSRSRRRRRSEGRWRRQGAGVRRCRRGRGSCSSDEVHRWRHSAVGGGVRQVRQRRAPADPLELEACGR